MGLTFIAIVLLAGAWAAILLPDLRNRGGAPRRNNSVKSFRQQLSGLDRTRPQNTRPHNMVPRPGLTSRPPTARPGAPMMTPRPRTGTAGPAPTRVARTTAPMPSSRLRPNAPVDTRSSMMPRNRVEAAKRRALTASVLVGLALITLIGGIAVNRTLLFAHLLVDAVLAGFVYLSWERSNRAGARRSSLVTLGRDRDAEQAGHDEVATVSPIARRAAGG